MGFYAILLFMDQSHVFYTDDADWQYYIRNSPQEYSFHLYCGGTSSPEYAQLRKSCKHTYIGKMSPSLPKFVINTLCQIIHFNSLCLYPSEDPYTL